MHIELRDERRERLFAVDVDISDPPAIVHAPDGQGQAVHLDWDRALDDEQHLRHCPVCGCPELFARKTLPQLTAFAVVVLAAIVSMVLYGIGQPGAALAVFLVVVAIDAAIYLFTQRALICYRCRSRFTGMPIRRDHPGWDKALGEQYPPADVSDGADSADSTDLDDDDMESSTDDQPPLSPSTGGTDSRQNNGAQTR